MEMANMEADKFVSSHLLVLRFTFYLRQNLVSWKGTRSELKSLELISMHTTRLFTELVGKGYDYRPVHVMQLYWNK